MSKVYRVKVLRKRVERAERKRMQNYKVHPERLSALEELLNEIYTICRPKPSDYELRRDLVSVFNEIAKDIYGRSGNVPVVEEFGSFVMDLFHSKSDLDISVNFDNSSVKISHEKKIQTLRKFARKLYALQRDGHVSGVHPITAAKVPILKVVDCGTKIECDISVENRDGVSKSKIIHMICSLDERFQKLSFLMKAWAKAQNINSSRDKTLNSLSIILLVAFHLQTRNPPILPPFSAILKDGSDPDSVEKSLNKFVNYGKSNKESVAELLVTLIIKLLSVEKLWDKGLCASTYEASWLSKTWDSKVCCISVEDFTDQSQNVARAVGKGEVKQIYKCIQRTSEYISAYMDGLVELPALRYQLFRHAAAPFKVDSQTSNIEENGNSITLPCRDIKNKEDQSTEGQKESQGAIPSEPITTKKKWSSEGWEGLASEPITTKKKWSTEGWEGLASKPITTKIKWSTEGWEGLASKPMSTKRKWSTEDWEGLASKPITAKKKWSSEGWERLASKPITTKKKWSTEDWKELPSEPITAKKKWSSEGWEGLASESITTKRKWSTEGWEGFASKPITTKRKWSTEGWEGFASKPTTTKRKWSTEGWERLPSVTWGQSKEDGLPPDSLWTKRKTSEETTGGTSSAQWLRKSDTKRWFARKNNNKCAPKAKWSNTQTRG
ncbi:PREDICTED: protein HESO1-like isoform X2 [Nicotiana attenuata]|uniref:Protein heso1 n=1 Tax=Nicotiana attenuata TaxID=49451 RepID=A0A1J6IL71_NICAT|nr:PREDICTED: protein HESO1-like isoform X2 [Nicotiana attenuata]OIS98470.1 protein heso1 [Nicotiana attenuata]